MVQLNSDVKSNAEWGFLKNIVNIDTFFASGADQKKASGGDSELF